MSGGLASRAVERELLIAGGPGGRESPRPRGPRPFVGPVGLDAPSARPPRRRLRVML